MERLCRLAAAAVCVGLLGMAGVQAQTVQPLVTGIFTLPVGAAMDSAGNLYVANDEANTISKVTPSGIVSVFVAANQGLDFPEGLAFDSAGNLYVANSGNDTIDLVSPAGAVSTFASNDIGEPMGLAFDNAGNLYSSDNSGSTIFKITPTGTVSVIASDKRFLASPLGLAFDAAGNLYVANLLPTPDGGGISIVTPAGAISTFAKLSDPNFLFPAYLGFDGNGNLFATSALGPIDEISPAGVVTTVNTTGFVSPRGLTLDSAGDLFIVDLSAMTLGKLAPDGTVTNVAGNVLASPNFLTTDGNGNIYVPSAGSRTITKVAPDGTPTILVSRAAGIKSPAGLAFGPDGTLFAADAEAEAIDKVAADGTVTLFVDLSADGVVPQGLAFDAAGTLFVADSSNAQVLEITPAGAVSTFVSRPQGIVSPEGLAFDSIGNLVIADAGFGTIVKAAPDGTVNTFVPTSAGLSAPQGLAFDANGTLYVANSPGGAMPPGIVAVSPQGVVTMYAQGIAGLADPIGLAFAAPATLFAADVTSGSLFQIAVPPPPEPAPLLASILPDARAVEVGRPATVFATILNTGAGDLDQCGISLPSTAPAGLSLSFQATDPKTNQPIGTANQAVAIAANGSQSFLLTFDAGSALVATGLAPVFDCAGVQPAPLIPGVDTLDLSFSATPVADVIALAATIGQTGIVTVPFSQNAPGAFALATANVGATENLTVTTDTGAATLPLSIVLCQTDPASGQCLQPMAATVPIAFDAGATPTFSVFVTAAAPVTLAPATARIFVRVMDGAGQSHGSTSVAVQTR
jgi:sugar lactone lactonase YvrE